MSDSLWESGAAVEAEVQEPVAEVQEPVAEPAALTVSVDDFSALEGRILRAVEMVKRERQERAAAEALSKAAEQRATLAEERAAGAEVLLHAEAASLEQMQADLHTLRAERDHVRQRVERLLEQLDGLEL